MSELDPFGRSDMFWFALGLGAFLLTLVSVAIVILAIRERRAKRGIIAGVLATAFYLEVQFISKNCSIARGVDRPRANAAAFLAIDPAVLMVANVVAVAVLAALIVRIVRWERRRITPMSIKEAIDDLPTGMCCFTSAGMILMVNRTMEGLAFELFDEAPVNARFLRDRLFAGDMVSGCEVVRGGEAPVVRTSAGRVWSFVERGIAFAGREARLLTASDVTELYEKTAELDAKRRELAASNERLMQMNREVVALAAAREVVDAKVRIHDEFGESLLAIRRALADAAEGEAVPNADALADRLRRSLEVLRAGGTREAADEYALMLDTAANLGVTVEVTGELPQLQPAKRIVATAIHECLTNTIRHAHGTHLSCTVADAGDAFAITFTNDGDVPTTPVAERGGLRTLRSLVEDAGGSMEIAVEPRFAIRLTLPKEGNHDL